MSTFDFYREAKLNYTSIVPLREDGLVLFYLYEKLQKGDFANDEFSELDLLTAIEFVYADVKGENSKRVEYERNNDTIIRLQEFFIWRDEKKKRYSFKSYGIEFCKNIKLQLKQFYSPTEIKAIFDSLNLELQTAKLNEDSFLKWMEVHFEVRNANISRQIEILDQQVGDAVRTFRSRLLSEENEINQVIADALDSLKQIKQNSDEFRNAFQGTYEIEDCLLYIQEQLTIADQTLTKIRKVREFIKRLRIHLELVSKRIDLIQPRLREFIHDFNQRDFDRKTELFLKFLLKSAIGNKDHSGFFTSNIIREKTPVFTILLKRNIGIPRVIELGDRKIDTAKREQSLALVQKKRGIRQRVLSWMVDIETQLKQHGELRFASLFFKILATEKENQLTIAVKVAHQAVLKYTTGKHYNVSIEKNIEADNNFKTVIWKMLIKTKEAGIIPS